MSWGFQHHGQRQSIALTSSSPLEIAQLGQGTTQKWLGVPNKHYVSTKNISTENTRDTFSDADEEADCACNVHNGLIIDVRDDEFIEISTIV
jgi:hypothetical protein